MTDLALLRAFGLEALYEAPVHSNGHAHPTAICFNCGEEFEAKRHVPGTRAVCGKAECKRAAGAQRQANLRQRRKQS
jgi:hypothetical protein